MLVSVAACGGQAPAPAPPAPAICSGPLTISGQAGLAELGRCTAVDGDVTIRGAARLDFRSLDRLESVAGTLTVGPTFDTDVIALAGLTGVNRLRIVSNGMAGSLHLPKLEHVDAIEIAANLALASVALGGLQRVEEDLVVSQNPSLEILDLGGLDEVGGLLQLRNNAILQVVDVRELTHAGEVDLTGSALAADHPLRARFAAESPPSME